MRGAVTPVTRRSIGRATPPTRQPLHSATRSILLSTEIASKHETDSADGELMVRRHARQPVRMGAASRVKRYTLQRLAPQLQAVDPGEAVQGSAAFLPSTSIQRRASNVVCYRGRACFTWHAFGWHMPARALESFPGKMKLPLPARCFRVRNAFQQLSPLRKSAPTQYALYNTLLCVYHLGPDGL